jgi:ubiquinone/menaquinone biosynthesis C-methylase UbiE
MSLAASEIVGPHGKVYAIDIYEPSIDTLNKEINERKLKNIEAMVADMTDKTPVPTHGVDVCLVANVMHGFVENEEADKVMIEITRLLKFGGTLAIIEFKKERDIPGPPLNVKLSPRQTTSLITPYRYREKQVVEVGPYHYASIFIKV